jgi:hypothetical protein
MSMPGIEASMARFEASMPGIDARIRGVACVL